MSSRPVHDTEVTLRSNRFSPGLAAGALTVFIALFAASPALAGTATGSGSTVSFTDSSGVANDVTFTTTSGGATAVLYDIGFSRS